MIFIADDHGQLDSTPYGATDVQTPNMKRLAKAGMTFTHAFAACAPSRASILTGLMPNRASRLSFQQACDGGLPVSRRPGKAVKPLA